MGSSSSTWVAAPRARNTRTISRPTAVRIPTPFQHTRARTHTEDVCVCEGEYGTSTPRGSRRMDTRRTHERTHARTHGGSLDWRTHHTHARTTAGGGGENGLIRDLSHHKCAGLHTVFCSFGPSAAVAAAVEDRRKEKRTHTPLVFSSVFVAVRFCVSHRGVYRRRWPAQ